jgi:endo-1,4-beta-xylanase
MAWIGHGRPAWRPIMPGMRHLLLAALACLATAAEPSLAQAFAGRFAIGMALGQRETADPAVLALVARHATAVSPENIMKPGPLQPRPGAFSFAAADAFVALAAERGWTVYGHTLTWHIQGADWMFTGPDGAPAGRESVLERQRTHIATVAGRYAGRIRAWDVVNEALADGGGAEDLRDSPWSRACGWDFVPNAFRAAAAADPQAQLLYNDYMIESEPKRSRALRLVARLRAEGCRVDGIGIQGHWTLDHPPIADIEAGIRAFAAAGLAVHITELDVAVLPRQAVGADLQARDGTVADPYRDGLPPAMQERLARRYAEIFACFVRNADAIERVTFWGAHDGASWLNDWPVKGRTDHPLLFDRALQPKPAFAAVLAEAAR